jgi:hypothetical protein
MITFELIKVHNMGFIEFFMKNINPCIIRLTFQHIIENITLF